MNDALQRAPAIAATSRANLTRAFAAAGLEWIVPEWPAPPHVTAFTTTRARDASSATHPQHDTRAIENGWRAKQERETLSAFLPRPPVWLKQVHGANVIVLDEPSIAARDTPPVADAAVTRLRETVCAVSTADCLPVLFADRRGETVGAAHAGWRGLSSGVLEATVRSLMALGAEPNELFAWLGPAIGPSAFEVGADVFAAFCDDDPQAQRYFHRHREDKWHADLYALARHRLARCGVSDVTGGGWCTHTDATRFHSYRRERTAGRMVTAVWIAPDADPPTPYGPR